MAEDNNKDLETEETPVENIAVEQTPVEESTDELSALLTKLDEATAEIQVAKDRHLRAVAEMENFRKRAIRDKEDARLGAKLSVLEDFLPVVDNFKMGLQVAEAHEGGKVFAEGFAMVLTQIENMLKQHGVETLNPKGEVFDPNFHESVAHVPSEEVEEGSVIEVTRIGYRLGERLLRAAVVVVSSGASDGNEAETAKEEG